MKQIDTSGWVRLEDDEEQPLNTQESAAPSAVSAIDTSKWVRLPDEGEEEVAAPGYTPPEAIGEPIEEDTGVLQRMGRAWDAFTTLPEEKTPEQEQEAQLQRAEQYNPNPATGGGGYYGTGGNTEVDENIINQTKDMINNKALDMMRRNPDMDYDVAVNKAKSEMKGDAVEFAADILLTAASGGLYAGARTVGTKIAPKAIAAVDKATDASRLANAGKYAAIGGTEAAAAGVAGNVAAGRDTFEGTGTDLTIGGLVGGLAGAAFKPKSADIQTRADTYTGAREEFGARTEQARQANELDVIKAKLDQEAGIAKKVGDTPADVKPETYAAEYKTQRKVVEDEARKVMGKNVDSIITKRDGILSEKKSASAEKIAEYQRVIDTDGMGNPEIKREYEALIKQESDKYRDSVLKMDDDFDVLVSEASKARNKLKPGGRAQNEMDIRIDELENERMYTQYDLKLESDRRIELYRETMDSELAAGTGAPREVRRKYNDMIAKEKELFNSESTAIKAEYDGFIKAEQEAFSAAAPTRTVEASDNAARIVQEQADNLYRRAYQTEADKLGVNARERLTQGDLDVLSREMSSLSKKDAERIAELEKYVDDTIPTYQTSTRGEFNPDVYNIPPTNTSFYRDFGGEDRLKNIIEGKREYAANPRENVAMEEMAIADLMERDLKTRGSIDLANTSNAGLISRFGKNLETGGTMGVADVVRGKQVDTAIDKSRKEAMNVLDDSISKLTTQLSARVQDKTVRAEVEAAKKALESLRKKVDNGKEIDALDVAPILGHVNKETLQTVEDMVSLSAYTNRFDVDKGADLWSARGMFNLGSRLLGGAVSVSTLGKGAGAVPAIRELLTSGKKSEMITANQLSKLQLSEKGAVRNVDEAVDELAGASSLKTKEDFYRAREARDELVAERNADVDYARYEELSGKGSSRSKAEETEVNKLYNKFAGIDAEISRLNRAIGATKNRPEGITPEKRVQRARKSVEKSGEVAKKAREELKAKLDSMSKSDQLRYLKNKALRDAARFVNEEE